MKVWRRYAGVQGGLIRKRGGRCAARRRKSWDMDSYREKVERLKEQMAQYASEDVAVAFSGGVDSSLILKLACKEAERTGRTVYGVLFHTMLHPSGDIEEARKTAREAGAKFQVLEVDELGAAGIEDNPRDRCYRCKRYLFERLREKAEELGVRNILEGTNEDDMHMYRPGIQAVRELGILSPLAYAGLTKEEIRKLAREEGISVAGKPSTPCLATRFPYGSRLSYEEMGRVEEAEKWLRGLGLYNVRLRAHGEVARIETDKEDLGRILEKREEAVSRLKALGYKYVALDLEGFRSGSMDE